MFKENLVAQQEQLQTELNACSKSDSVLIGSNSKPLESDDVSDVRNHISPLTIVINVGMAMKANEFIKKHGIKKTSSELSVFQSSLAVEFGCVFVDELKRLVESLELVEFVGGDLDGANSFCEFADDMKYLQKRGRLILVEDIRKAIVDVES